MEKGNQEENSKEEIKDPHAWRSAEVSVNLVEKEAKNKLEVKFFKGQTGKNTFFYTERYKVRTLQHWHNCSLLLLWFSGW